MSSVEEATGAVAVSSRVVAKVTGIGTDLDLRDWK